MDSILTSVAHVLVEALIPIILAGVAALVGLAFDKFRLQRLGLKREWLVAEMQALVLAYEEKIEAQVKQGLIPAAQKGEAKLASVLADFLNKHPQVTDAEADVLAHQAIATVGVGAADFLAKLLAATHTKTAEAQ